MTDEPKKNDALEDEEKEMIKEGDEGKYVVGEDVNKDHKTPSNQKPS